MVDLTEPPRCSKCRFTMPYDEPDEMGRCADCARGYRAFTGVGLTRAMDLGAKANAELAEFRRERDRIWHERN